MAAAGIGLALAWCYQQQLHEALSWLRQHVLMLSAVIGFLSAVLVARHRTASRAEFAQSWLAALPVRRPVARLEALRIELQPAIVGVATWTALLVLTEFALGVNSGGGGRDALIVWLWLAAATMVGAAASYAFPGKKPLTLPPGSRYVPKPSSQRGRPLRPSLTALGRWPVRTMFARAQPKLIARSLVPVLLSMGLGSTADTAMVVVGLFAAIGALTLLVPSVIEVSRAALRWLSSLPVTARRLLQVILGRSCGVILGVSAAVGLLLPLLHVSSGAAARAAALLALASTVATILGVAVLRGVRRS